MKTLRYLKSYRLHSSEYQAAFQGKRIYCKHFMMVASKVEAAPNKLGIITSKKKLPKAIQRHRCRRLIREKFRLCQNDFHYYHMVVVANHSAATATKQELWQCLDHCWQQLAKA